jgi:hypothetical protein
MTVEELLKRNQVMGQGGASQYLSMPQQQYSGAGQYLGGLLGQPINYSAPTNNAVSQYTTPTYQPTPWEGPSKMYQFGNMLSTSGHPIFELIGRDMMSKNPLTQWTFTPN